METDSCRNKRKSSDVRCCWFIELTFAQISSVEYFCFIRRHDINQTMQKRYNYIDILRTISVFAVVFLHVLVPKVVLYGFAPLLSWDASIFLSSLTRFAVPLFVMVSGALLLDNKQERDSAFFRKRMLRIGIPLMFWVTVYAYFRHSVDGLPFSFSFILNQLLFNQPYEHLYFLVILLELMVLTPYLRRHMNTSNTLSKLLPLLLIILTTFLWVPNRFVLFLFVPYISYYILGNILKNIDTSKLLPISAAMLALSILGTFLLTHFLTVSGVTDNLYFFSFTNPIVFITTVSLFIIVKEICRGKKTLPFSESISSHAMGIYLIHPLILFFFNQIVTMNNGMYIFLSPIIALAVLLSSFGVSLALEKVPVMRKVVGFSS